MSNRISKMTTLLTGPQEAILQIVIVKPVSAIHRYPEVGTLSVGSSADVAFFNLETGVFAFMDAWHTKRLGTKRLNKLPHREVMEGLLHDLNGLVSSALDHCRGLQGDRVSGAKLTARGFTRLRSVFSQPAAHRTLMADPPAGVGRIHRRAFLFWLACHWS